MHSLFVASEFVDGLLEGRNHCVTYVAFALDDGGVGLCWLSVGHIDDSFMLVVIV